jgi:ATP-dependent DNA helicase RecQ
MQSSEPTRAAGDDALQSLMATIERHWGYRSLRPLQEHAMRAVIAGRDSLLVLPTGGGKSLCYQAPAIVRGDTTVVVSPLISLMKDQVDGLRACGVAAMQLNSSMSAEEQRRGEESLHRGDVRLLFLSPERLATAGCRRLLASAGVKRFAIDEAHCISHWGHDFRPDYRQLGELKRLFPGSSVHAFTATATRKVREDIVAQLGLDAPEVLVGNFDRANLTYRVARRGDVAAQAMECLGRHQGESGIIYCIRRRDVEDLVAVLVAQGVRALAYHAGMTPPQRKKTQDAFREERCDVVVATVAFGMGIDRSNVRYVLHTGMPKSIEHYQQETGRAGRDGLEAECTLLYSPSDAITWQRMFDKSVAESEAPVDPEYIRSVERHVAEMDGYCRRRRCRHRALVEYFDQQYAPANCEACDVCLGDALPVPDGHTIAKKILSCVARLKEQYGVAYVISVLRGDRSELIYQRGHNGLSTYALLAEQEKADLRDWIEQLIDQQVLVRTLRGR